MSKLTKNERIAELERKVEALEKWSVGADNMLTELNHALPDHEYYAQCEADEADVNALLDRHCERLGLNQPKLKQLDQSIFDGLDEDIVYAAINGSGEAVGSSKPIKLVLGGEFWFMKLSAKIKRLGVGYDTTNWQNSLIEREPKELTGSDLCRAMLSKFNKPIMCRVSRNYIGGESYGFDLIKSFRTDGEKYFFHGRREGEWIVATPINNQGEPLTATDVGL